MVSKKSYIGQTFDFFGGIKNEGKQKTKGRKKIHLVYAKNGSNEHPKFYRAIRKHGEEKFEWSILQSCKNLSTSQIDDCEKYWIKKYDSVARGYNCLGGGHGRNPGYVCSEETKAKISNSSKNRSIEHRRKISISNAKNKYCVGRIMSSETRLKISISKKGKKLSEEHKKKIGLAGQGRTHSLETKKKMAAWQTGRSRSEETIKKMSLSQMGKKASPETKAKMSESRKRFLSSRMVDHASS